MSRKASEGVIWAVITALCGLGATKSQEPAPKLAFSLAAIATGTMAVDCFTSTARASYQQLAANRECYQLPSHIPWVEMPKNSSGPSQGIRPTL